MTKTDQITKTCSKCNTAKTPGEFSRDSSKKDGRVPQCKTCRRKYRKDNAKALAAQAKVYKARPESRFKTYRDSAKYRGFKWKLTYKQFMMYWQVPCGWCGSSIETIGLDRVDPGKPYQKGNIEACCKHCNRMKSDLTAKEFAAQIACIYQNLIKKSVSGSAVNTHSFI